MVRGAFKSNSQRKVSYRNTSGSSERYEDRKHGKATSPSGAVLQAVASGKKSEMKKLSKTAKRPNRPYGGRLTSPEMRALLRAEARELSSE